MNQRGFTLIEFLVASAIASIVTVGVLELLRGQISGYDRQQRVQDAQASVREAMDEITSRVQSAGFGVAPEYTVGGRRANNLATIGAAPDFVCPGTDVLEVLQRDPVGFWKTSGGNATSISTRKPLSSEMDSGIPAGKPINYLMPKGLGLFVFASPGNYGLVRVNTATNITSTTVVGVPLLSDTESQRVMVLPMTVGDVSPIQTSRFFVSCNNVKHPMLMLDQGFDSDNDGNTDVVLVANEIEDLQVAYLLDVNTDGILDNAELAAPAHTLTSALQISQIKAIRISIVGRSATELFKDYQSSSIKVSGPPTLEDHTPTAGEDRLARRVLQQTILLDNRDTAKGLEYTHFSSRYL